MISPVHLTCTCTCGDGSFFGDGGRAVAFKYKASTSVKQTSTCHTATLTGGHDTINRDHRVCSTFPPSTAAAPPVLAIILRLRRALLAPELTPEVNARPGGQDDGGGCWLSCGVARSVMRTPVALRRLARLEGERHKG
eukprot:scaffold37810_cov69-Phaeocystis_antarctica.AAC.1